MNAIQKRLNKDLEDMFKIVGEGNLVVNRDACDHFTHVARDAAYAYESNVLVCERFYKREVCTKQVHYIELKDEEQLKAVTQELFPAKMTSKKYKEQLEKYKAAIQDIPSKLEEVTTYFYKPEYESRKYLLTEYRENPSFFSQLSTYAMTYFMVNQPFIMETSSPFEVKMVEDTDYIDVVVVLKKTMT